MKSLLDVLEHRPNDALATMTKMEIQREPEGVFYLARHFAMLSVASDAVHLLKQARSEGLTSSYTLEHDEAFAPVRRHAEFQHELAQARAIERTTRRELDRASGGRLMAVIAGSAGRVL